MRRTYGKPELLRLGLLRALTLNGVSCFDPGAGGIGILSLGC